MSRRALLVLLLAALPIIVWGQGGTQGFWTAINPLPSGHRNHTATTLADSKILVAGGLTDPLGTNLPPSTSAVLYRPEFNDWLAVSPMAGARFLHAAAPILGGTAVLVAGGFSDVLSLSPPLRANLGGDLGSCGTSPSFSIINTTAEIFHENTLGWTAAASMNDARAEFTMVTLPNGMVLAAGSGSAEIYNPITDTWTRTSGMQATRFGAAGTLLPDGRVFLAGGDSGGGFLGNFCPADAEVYDPSVNIWFNAGGMTVDHFHATATPYHLVNGSLRVLVAGGFDGNDPNLAVISTAESWNPATNTFIPAGNMLVPRAFHAATLRPDGKILVTGGINELGDVETSSEVYDPATNSWSIAAPMIFPHAGHTALNVTDLNGNPTGKILVAGGQSGGPVTATAEIFQPTPLASITSIGTQNLGNSGAVSACQLGAIIATVGSATGLGTPTGSVRFLGNFGGELVGLGPTRVNNGVYSLDAVLPAGNYQILARYSGDSSFLPSDSQTLAVQSVAPPIVIAGPATATAGKQITLTASVDGAVGPFSFVWTLPNGANVNGNGNSILVTPAIGQNQYTVNSDPNAIGCNLAPGFFTVFGYAQGVLLNSQAATLGRDASTGDIVFLLTVTNNGSDTARVQITGSTLNNIATSTTLPVSLGNLVSGQSNIAILHYPGNAGASGTTGVLRVNLTYTDLQTGTAGNAGGGLRVTIP